MVILTSRVGSWHIDWRQFRPDVWHVSAAATTVSAMVAATLLATLAGLVF